MKVIHLRFCSDCKWWEANDCYHKMHPYGYREIDVATDAMDSFPDWCPLEDHDNNHVEMLELAIRTHCNGDLMPEEVIEAYPKYGKMLDKHWWEEAE